MCGYILQSACWPENISHLTRLKQSPQVTYILLRPVNPPPNPLTREGKDKTHVNLVLKSFKFIYKANRILILKTVNMGLDGPASLLANVVPRLGQCTVMCTCPWSWLFFLIELFKKANISLNIWTTYTRVLLPQSDGCVQAFFLQKKNFP